MQRKETFSSFSIFFFYFHIFSIEHTFIARLIVFSERSGASCEPLHAVRALWKLTADMFLNSTPAEVALCAVRSDQNATFDLHRSYCILMFPLEIQSTYQLCLRRVPKCHPEFNTASARTDSAAFLNAPWHGYVGPGTPQTMQIAGFLKTFWAPPYPHP